MGPCAESRVYVFFISVNLPGARSSRYNLIRFQSECNLKCVPVTLESKPVIFSFQGKFNLSRELGFP